MSPVYISYQRDLSIIHLSSFTHTHNIYTSKQLIFVAGSHMFIVTIEATACEIRQALNCIIVFCMSDSVCHLVIDF